MPLTFAQAETRLWAHAHSERVTVKLGPKDHDYYGWVSFILGEHRVRINKATREMMLRTLVHELAHAAFRVELGPWGAIEEPIVNDVLEPGIWKAITRSAGKRRRWEAYLDAVTEAAR